MNKLVLSKARELIRDVRGTDLEKTTQIYDLLCNHITYTVDDTTEADDCCVGAILNGKANCDGYSDAFTLCASLCGLTVRYIAGDSLKKDVTREEAGHLWNLILLDGTWRSLDVTWGDQEEDGISYEYFNIGLDRMEQEYSFTKELLPAPFAGATDLSGRPVREWTAESPEELSAAVEEILSAGLDEAVIRLSQAMFDQYREDPAVVNYPLAAAGTEAEEILYSVSARTVTLEGLHRMEHWAFCRTRGELIQAFRQMCAVQAQTCCLTLETALFDRYLEDPGVLTYSLAAAGAEAEKIWYSLYNRTVTLEGLHALEEWAFCRTRDEIAEAVANKGAEQAQTCCLTLEKELFSELFSEQQLTTFKKLLARGGIFAANLSWRNDSCTVTVEEAEWREGWYAEDVGSARQLSEAVRAGRKQGCRNFYLCLSDTLYQAMMENTGRLAQAVRDGGIRDGWSYYHWDDSCSIYIIGD